MSLGHSHCLQFSCKVSFEFSKCIKHEVAFLLPSYIFSSSIISVVENIDFTGTDNVNVTKQNLVSSAIMGYFVTDIFLCSRNSQADK